MIFNSSFLKKETSFSKFRQHFTSSSSPTSLSSIFISVFIIFLSLVRVFVKKTFTVYTTKTSFFKINYWNNENNQQSTMLALHRSLVDWAFVNPPNIQRIAKFASFNSKAVVWTCLVPCQSHLRTMHEEISYGQAPSSTISQKSGQAVGCPEFPPRTSTNC